MGEARRRRAASMAAGVRPGKVAALVAWFAAGLAASIPVLLLVPGSSAAAARAWTALEVWAGGSRAAKGGGESGPPGGGPDASIEALLGRGFDLISAERYGEAYDEFARASAIAPRSARAQWGLALVYQNLQFSELAERAHRRAIEFDRTCWPAKEGLVQILCNSGRHGEALDLLADMERERPDNTFVWGEIALNRLRTGKPREAIPYIERYIAAIPGQTWGHAHLGRALADLGDAAGAEAALRRAVEMDPRMGLAQLWLGQVLVAAGRRAEGEVHLKAFSRLRIAATQAHRLETQIGRNPDDFDSLVALARLRILLGKTEAARPILERAMDLHPADEEIRRLYRSVTAPGGGPSEPRH